MRADDDAFAPQRGIRAFDQADDILEVRLMIALAREAVVPAFAEQGLEPRLLVFADDVFGRLGGVRGAGLASS